MEKKDGKTEGEHRAEWAKVVIELFAETRKHELTELLEKLRAVLKQKVAVEDNQAAEKAAIDRLTKQPRVFLELMNELLEELASFNKHLGKQAQALDAKSDDYLKQVSTLSRSLQFVETHIQPLRIKSRLLEAAIKKVDESKKE